MTTPDPNATAPATEPDTTPAPAAPPVEAPAQEETDWKAEARKWEKRAKENSKAADELDKVRKASMSEQEKAVEVAKAEGRTAAAQEFGRRLAAAEFRAAIAAKGLDLGEALELIDTTRFVDESGEVDEKAIKAAVAKLAKAIPQAPAAGGADFQGAGGQTPASLDQQIAEAEKARDYQRAIALKRQRAALQTP